MTAGPSLWLGQLERRELNWRRQRRGRRGKVGGEGGATSPFQHTQMTRFIIAGNFSSYTHCFRQQRGRRLFPPVTGSLRDGKAAWSDMCASLSKGELKIHIPRPTDESPGGPGKLQLLQWTSVGEHRALAWCWGKRLSGSPGPALALGSPSLSAAHWALGCLLGCRQQAVKPIFQL